MQKKPVAIAFVAGQAAGQAGMPPMPVTPLPGAGAGAGLDFITGLAHQIAEQSVVLLLARLPKPTVIQPRYMTVEQAAQYIGHTKKSFEYLLSKCLFPVIRHDRLVLIDRDDLDKWMARHKC
jgi:excisionase family DNA binding protein